MGRQKAFSHGSSNSCGTAILFNNNANCTMLSTIPDPLGRFIILKVQVDDKFQFFSQIAHLATD